MELVVKRGHLYPHKDYRPATEKSPLRETAIGRHLARGQLAPASLSGS